MEEASPKQVGGKKKATTSRAKSQVVRARQVADGWRPPTPPTKVGWISVVTANVTHANSLRKELEAGDAFRHDDFLLLEERKLQSEALPAAEN